MCQFCKNKGLPYNIWNSHRVFNCTDPQNPQGKNYNGNQTQSNSQKKCRVLSCDGRHRGGHYCRNCHDNDSDHWSNQCLLKDSNLNQMDKSGTPSSTPSGTPGGTPGGNPSGTPGGTPTTNDTENDSTNISPVDDWNSQDYDPSVIIDETGKLDQRYEEKKKGLIHLSKCNRKWYNYLMQNNMIPKPFTQKVNQLPTKEIGKSEGQIILTTMKTDEAILMYRDQGSICIWNCGSGQKPLGGYMAGHGQRAQEEDVARKSTLSSALLDAKNGGLYPINDGILYTIDLTLLRSGPQFHQLDDNKWTNFSAITSAAPNMQGYFKGKTFHDVKDNIEEKLEKMFIVPEEEILIPAGWGCGSFAPSRSSPDIHNEYIESIAITIANNLNQHKNRFKKIIFTLPDPKIYSLFEKKFQEYSLI